MPSINKAYKGNQMFGGIKICDWIWEKPPSTHNYKYLEILILIIWSSITQEGK